MSMKYCEMNCPKYLPAWNEQSGDVINKMYVKHRDL